MKHSRGAGKVGDPTERLRVVIETQRALASEGRDLSAVMTLICDRTRILTGADTGSVLMVEGDYLVHRAVTGALDVLVGEQLAIADTFSGSVYLSNKGAICNDTRRLANKLALERGIASLIVVPLNHRGATVGLVTVLSRTTGAFDDDDLSTLELLSVVLSAALSHASEFEWLARFQAVFEGASIGIVRLDSDGRVYEANPALEKMLGYTVAQLRDGNFCSHAHPEDADENSALFREMMDGSRESFRLESRYLRADGSTLWAQITAVLERDEQGSPGDAIWMIEDISDRKAAELELLRQSRLNEHQSLHDALTGLPNRVLFRDRIEQAIANGRRAGGRLAILIMDLDRFKQINDSLGHHAGDVLLGEVARRLEGALRESDTVARLGGDEFGMLLPTKREPEVVTPLLEKLCRALDAPIVLSDLPLSIEYSIGVAFWPDNGQDVDAVLQRADVAMYRAKEEGTPFAFYDEAVDGHGTTQLRLVGELHRALAEGELLFHYQPKIVLATGEVDSVEALVRWCHPRLGLVPPDDFVPLAQETGFIRPLTLHLIELALRQSRAWHDEGLVVPIAVNLSTRTLRDQDFPAQVARLLTETHVESSLLQFEITESAMLADPGRAMLILDKLAAMGIRLSIDDFGTGYSSLAYLKRLPVNEIKIDRSFVMHMDVDDDDAAIVRSTIELARNLGLEVVAEGVESEMIRRQLVTLGCTFAQGFHLGRPAPAAELTPWLRRQTIAPRRRFRVDLGAVG